MRDLGLLLLRLILGGVFIVHGYPKVFGGPGKTVPEPLRRHLGPGFSQSLERGGIENFRNTVSGLGTPAPGVMAWVGALAELVGGTLLMLGWFTRPAALAICGNMTMAISRVHWKNGLVGQGGYEFALVCLAGLLALLLGGPGAISIDGDD
jgi:putative oxidoreductase